MISILVRCAPDDEDRLTAELWEAGTSGIVDVPGGLRAFFEDDQLAEALVERFHAEYRFEEPTDWEQATLEAWPPMEVGERFFLAAPWREDPTPPGRLRLVIQPGMACGTGQHPCTQMCLEAMERYVTPGSTVLDIGTGSGILSEAARLLGAACVLACDVDFEALQVARERVHVPFFCGSAGVVRSDVADVVVANISSAVIEEMRAELLRVVRSGGVLILSGFPEWDCPEGFSPSKTLRRDEWVCLVSVR